MVINSCCAQTPVHRGNPWNVFGEQQHLTCFYMERKT